MAEKEYIERGAVISCILEVNHNLAGVIQHINEHVPAADVTEVRHGEWIEHIVKPDWLEDDAEVYYNCSECGSSHWSIEPPYCPNCGAKMDGERKEQK